MSTRYSYRSWKARFHVAAACLVAVEVLGSSSLLADDRSGAPVRQSICERGDVVHRVELRHVAEVPGVCDIVHAMADENVEERTLHQGSADGAFCRARFGDHVSSLIRNGWTCSMSVQATRDRSATPSMSAETDTGAIASSPRLAQAPRSVVDSSSISLWRAECQAAMSAKGPEAARICRCAIDVLGEAGFEASDYALLASPYRPGEVRQPVHRAGLLYGVGMMAVDALARCGAP